MSRYFRLESLLPCDHDYINIDLKTFHGLPSLQISVPSTTSIHDLHTFVGDCLNLPDLFLQSCYLRTGHKIFSLGATAPISTYSDGSQVFSLYLSARLSGGKGGFGSQLRAAGGRMSSRKKRGQEENNDSCRNLDGRRIRTVKEAKALAEYLEIKPEMDKKEKEKRKERWLKVVEMAERREAEEQGKEVLGGKKFDDTKWLEQTEEERERTREAVLKAIQEGAFSNGNAGAGCSTIREGSPGSSGASSGDEVETGDAEKIKKMRLPATEKKATPTSGPKYAGFDDDDDEFMSSDDDDDDNDDEMEDIEVEIKGKGKARA